MVGAKDTGPRTSVSPRHGCGLSCRQRGAAGRGSTSISLLNPKLSDKKSRGSSILPRGKKKIALTFCTKETSVQNHLGHFLRAHLRGDFSLGIFHNPAHCQERATSTRIFDSAKGDKNTSLFKQTPEITDFIWLGNNSHLSLPYTRGEQQQVVKGSCFVLF